MKKFGTPIGAGPGSAKEKVGFDGVGTPLLVTGGAGVFGLAAFFDFFGFLLFFGAAGCLTFAPASAEPGFSATGFCDLVWPPCAPPLDPVDLVELAGAVELVVGLGFGVVAVEVEVEVVVGAVLVVTVTAGVVAVAGGQDWVTFRIGSWTGSGSEFGSVSGATFWKVNCWPPTTVIVTVQPSADAFGMAPSPSTVTRHAATTAAIVSFRLFNTVAYSSRGMPRVNSSQLRSQVGLG